MATAAETYWAKQRQPGARLSGICARKPGYHGQRHLYPWGSDYSRRLIIDKDGPDDVCAACDTTLSQSEMIRTTRLLRDAALDPDDTRTSYIREFIGTLDGVNVVCWIHDSETAAFRFDGGRDSTHTWHRHDSYFRRYAHLPIAGEAIASIVNGETFGQWQARFGQPEGGSEVDNIIILYGGRAFNGNRLIRYHLNNWPMFLRAKAVPGTVVWPTTDGNGFPNTDLANLGWTAAEVDYVFGEDVANTQPPPPVDVDAVATGVVAAITPLLADTVDEAAIAARVVAALQTSGLDLTQAEVEAAVRAAFSHGLAP